MNKIFILIGEGFRRKLFTVLKEVKERMMELTLC